MKNLKTKNQLIALLESMETYSEIKPMSQAEVINHVADLKYFVGKIK